MSGTCYERLLNGEICGRPEMAQGKCIIHWGMNRGPQPLIEAIREYIRATSDDTINLSNMQFDNIVFPEGLFTTRPVSFKNSRLIGCRFEHSELIDADFTKTKLEETSFIDCTFIGKNALFKNATFSHTGDEPYDFIFGRCIFEEGLQLLDLSDIEWNCKQRPFVYCAILANEVDLSNAKIGGDHFAIAMAEGHGFHYDKMMLSAPMTVRLNGLIYHGHFELFFWPLKTASGPFLNFRNIDFRQMLSARFIRVDLQRAHFKDSEIETVSFVNVIWPTKDGRKILFDEYEYHDSSQFRELETLYTQLKRNYEDHRNYPAASDWHYREMEARRKSIKQGGKLLTWLRQNFFSFVPLYKYFSNYGESDIRPLIWLIGIAILAPVGLLLTGISETIGDRQPDVTNYWKALTYGLGNMIFIKSEVFRAASIWSELINIIQKLSVTLFGSLFLLALRRRFRR